MKNLHLRAPGVHGGAYNSRHSQLLLVQHTDFIGKLCWLKEITRNDEGFEMNEKLPKPLVQSHVLKLLFANLRHKSAVQRRNGRRRTVSGRSSMNACHSKKIV